MIRAATYFLTTIAAGIFVVLWWPFSAFMSSYDDEDDEGDELVVGQELIDEFNDEGEDVDGGLP